MDNATIILAALIGGGGLLGFGKIVARAAWGLAKELKTHSKELNDFKVKVLEWRANDSDDAKRHVEAQFARHIAECPARGNTGVRSK